VTAEDIFEKIAMILAFASIFLGVLAVLIEQSGRRRARYRWSNIVG